MKNIAVIVRGQPRTWKNVAENNIRVMKTSLNFGKIDWFFCFSETDTLSEETVRKDFDQDDFVSIQFLKDENYVLYSDDKHSVPIWRYFPRAYYRQAYFEYHAGLTKRQREIDTGIRYCLTVILRPDCYFFDTNFFLEDLHMPQELSGYMRLNDSLGNLTGADFHFVAGSRAANLMSFRYLDSRYTDGIPGQAVLGGDLETPQYYMRANLIQQVEFHKPFFGYLLIRPNCVPFLKDRKELTENNQETIYHWDSLTRLEKIDLCKEYNIDPRDYFLVQDFFKNT